MGRMEAALLLLIHLYPAISPRDCARAEISHVVDGNGQIVIDQVIWWDWCSTCGRYRCVDWRRLDRCGRPARRGSYWWFEWTEGTRIHQVRTRVLSETWTPYDPELEDRKLHPIDRRRGV